MAFDFFPGAPKASVDWTQTPVRLPTYPGQLEAIEQNVTSIIKKVDQIPFKQIGDDLRKSLEGFDQTLASARTTLDNASRMNNSANTVTIQGCWNTA